MILRTRILGETGLLPFIGHFRFTTANTDMWVCGSGRVGTTAGVTGAFGVARYLENELAEVAQAHQSQDKNAILYQIWSRVMSTPSEALGPGGGRDLSLVLASGDADGVSITGVGLSGVFGRYPSGWRPLAGRGHPLLGQTGVPSQMPGVLILEDDPLELIATPTHQPAKLPPQTDLNARAGLQS